MCRAPAVLRCSVRSLLRATSCPWAGSCLLRQLRGHASSSHLNLKPGVTLAHVPLHFFKCAPGYPDLSVMYG